MTPPPPLSSSRRQRRRPRPRNLKHSSVLVGGILGAATIRQYNVSLIFYSSDATGTDVSLAIMLHEVDKPPPQVPKHPSHSIATATVVKETRDQYLSKSNNDFASEQGSNNSPKDEAKQQQRQQHANEPFTRQYTAHCFYREYPIPPPTAPQSSFLPLLADVFGSHDQTQVFLVVENHYNCHDHDHNNLAHLFSSTTHGNVTFDCVYEWDGSRVTSHPLLPFQRLPTSYSRVPYILIQCPVPLHLQSRLPPSGATETNMFLSLQPSLTMARQSGNHHHWPVLPPTNTTAGANLDPTLVGTTTSRAHEEYGAMPTLAHIPICSHAWPPFPTTRRTTTTRTTTTIPSRDEPYRPPPPPPTVGAHHDPTKKKKKKRKHNLSLMTRVSLSYERGTDGQRLSIDPLDIVSWLEYHVALGIIQHFYLYDDSPDPYQSLVHELCQPYIELGILTYVHYPKRDTECNVGTGKRLYTAQVIASNAALRRYENETEWMGHWDVDEYLVVSTKNRPWNGATTLTTTTQWASSLSPQSVLNGTLSQLNQEYILTPKQHSFDNIAIPRIAFGPCQSTTNNHSDPANQRSAHPSRLDALALDQKQCYRFDQTAPKGIYRTSTIRTFYVHWAWYLMNDTISGHGIRTKQVKPQMAFLAHLRNGKAAGTKFPHQGSNVFHNQIRSHLKFLMAQRFQTTNPALWQRLTQNHSQTQ